jgi:hypothetical protein
VNLERQAQIAGNLANKGYPIFESRQKIFKLKSVIVEGKNVRM